MLLHFIHFGLCKVPQIILTKLDNIYSGYMFFFVNSLCIHSFLEKLEQENGRTVRLCPFL